MHGAKIQNLHAVLSGLTTAEKKTQQLFSAPWVPSEQTINNTFSLSYIFAGYIFVCCWLCQQRGEDDDTHIVLYIAFQLSGAAD